MLWMLITGLMVITFFGMLALCVEDKNGDSVWFKMVEKLINKF